MGSAVCFADLPQEIVLYEIIKFVNIQDLPNILLVNRAFHDIITAIICANKYDDILLDRIGTGLHQKMGFYGITYADILTGPIHPRLFDQLTHIVSIPSSEQIDYMDIMFNYTIATKKHIANNTVVHSNMLIMQKDIFQNRHLHFKTLQLVFHIAQNYMHSRSQEIMMMSIITQMINNFEKEFWSSMNCLCSDEICKLLQRRSKKSFQEYHKAFITILGKISIDKLDVHLYKLYYVLMASLLLNKYKSIMPVSMCYTVTESIYDKMYIYSLYKNNSSCEMQLETIKMFVDIGNCHELYTSRIYIVLANFTYLNNILGKNYISQTIKMHHIKLLKVIYDKSLYIIAFLQVSDKYDETIKTIGTTILESTTKLIDEILL